MVYIDCYDGSLYAEPVYGLVEDASDPFGDVCFCSNHASTANTVPLPTVNIIWISRCILTPSHLHTMAT